ncbi:hypothetical protein LTR36_007072 [Oleoguttula mirabilis]|uniref:Uncharacterized protein n=1 Tax=Oleoguttula mirabilis TaxID=1507867 RepID=A0AAV9JB52_9PEZI|nr:hypothetical protein LTR36_007072 [Oleoguttula mirabilis]
MSSERPAASAGGAEEGDLAKAFQELARGEQTAAALEAQLNSMEAKIEALLAQADKDQQEAERLQAQRASSGDSGAGRISGAEPDGK